MQRGESHSSRAGACQLHACRRQLLVEVDALHAHQLQQGQENIAWQASGNVLGAYGNTKKLVAGCMHSSMCIRCSSDSESSLILAIG
jgi:hypothetical protein